MKILISGICGRMGTQLVSAAAYEHTLVGVDKDRSASLGIPTVSNFEEAEAETDIFGNAECIIDFSHHTLTPALLAFATRHNIPAVIATTGHTEKEKQAITDASRHIPLFYSANLSIGIALLAESAKRIASALPFAEIEIVETHHSGKLDSPSGTALSLANEIISCRPGSYTVCGRSGQVKRGSREIGIHSLRMGNHAGEHSIIIATPSQTLTLTHTVHDRAVFAEGALIAAHFIAGAERAGLYTMNDLQGSQNNKSEAAL